MVECDYSFPVNRTHSGISFLHHARFPYQPPYLFALLFTITCTPFDSLQHLITDCIPHCPPSLSLTTLLYHCLDLHTLPFSHLRQQFHPRPFLCSAPASPPLSCSPTTSHDHALQPKFYHLLAISSLWPSLAHTYTL